MSIASNKATPAAAIAEARGEEAAAAGEGRLAAYRKAAARGGANVQAGMPGSKDASATLKTHATPEQKTLDQAF